MSGRPEEGLYGNLESQSSNVSQGGRRRARSEFESDTDYSSVSRRRLEEMHRPQWTMSSRVEDILLEGSTNRTDMKLNEFLRSKLGGTAAVGENYNVTMEAFVQEPDAYVQDQQLLRRIVNLTAYQTLKIELEKRKILLEAIYKLNHEGVVFLEQWRDYEGKDTVTPFVCGTLNGVLTQVQREERREEEERKRREAEERKRRKEEKEKGVRQKKEKGVRQKKEKGVRKKKEKGVRKKKEKGVRKKKEKGVRKKKWNLPILLRSKMCCLKEGFAWIK
ncbi:retrotransposon hot spot (RHS) protein [Trypanosoma cruzi]|nr:retrotransposon hot spot (RHS) protein [Trypanosoma cruzi]